MLCGVRLLDKSREGRENNFRIEIWTKFADEKSEVATSMKAYLEEVIVGAILADNEEKTPIRITFSVHKSTPKPAAGAADGKAGGSGAGLKK